MKSTFQNFEFPRWISTSKCSLTFLVSCAFSVSSALKFFVLKSVYLGKLRLVSIFLIMAIVAFGCGKSAANIYLKKGKEYYKKQKYQMAIQFFEKTLEVDSSITEAKYYKALCYYGLGHNHKACEDMSVLMLRGYAPADSTLKNMGCFYFPVDTARTVEKK
jgi:tetratricopeptide (TPR) repeat protein